MKKMKRLLTEKNPKILAWGCQAHMLNLLEKDICDESMLEKINDVSKYFSNVHRAHGLLKEKGGNMPILPGETRWNSKIDSCESYVKNHAVYSEVIDEIEDTPTNIKRTIDNIAFKRRVAKYLENMKKFQITLDKLQADNCNFSDCISLWGELMTNEDLSEYERHVQRRFHDSYEPFFILAYLTDPKNKDNDTLVSEYIDETEEWLLSYDSEMMASYVKYQLKDKSFYPDYLFTEKMTQMGPRNWWKFLNQKAKNDHDQLKFTTFMVDLHGCPASSASLERWFSTFGLVWSKIRNRLGHGKAMKLVKIYRSLRSAE